MLKESAIGSVLFLLAGCSTTLTVPLAQLPALAAGESVVVDGYDLELDDVRKAQARPREGNELVVVAHVAEDDEHVERVVVASGSDAVPVAGSPDTSAESPVAIGLSPLSERLSLRGRGRFVMVLDRRQLAGVDVEFLTPADKRARIAGIVIGSVVGAAALGTLVAAAVSLNSGSMSGLSGFRMY